MTALSLLRKRLPESNGQAAKLTAADRLAAFEDVGHRLWPFVRYFGLCGADPDAVRAVADFGDLLGVGQNSAATTAETAQISQQQTIEEIAHWLENHRMNGRSVLRKTMTQLVQELRALKKGGAAQ